MENRSSILRLATLSLACALVGAAASLALGARVTWYEHLGVFNTLAVIMLALGVAALALSLAGLWRARLRNARLALVACLSLLFLATLVLDR
jgi:hypothetical protein